MKNFLTRLWAKWFAPKEPSQDNIDIAIAVVNKIKDLVNSGFSTWLAVVLDGVIPGDQKELIFKVRRAVAYALVALELAQKKHKVIETVAQNEQLTEALLLLRTINKKERGPLYQQMAAHIASELSNEVYESALALTRARYDKLI